MENVSKNSTNDKVLSQMKSENLHISPDDILCSLQPLIAEYFDGDCEYLGEGITLPPPTVKSSASWPRG